MKLHAIRHQPTGTWVVAVNLNLRRLNGRSSPIVLSDKPDIRCFRTPRSARALLRSMRRDREWLKAHGEVDPKDFIMVSVDAVIDPNSVTRVLLPEERADVR